MFDFENLEVYKKAKAFNAIRNNRAAFVGGQYGYTPGFGPLLQW